MQMTKRRESELNDFRNSIKFIQMEIFRREIGLDEELIGKKV